MSELRWIILAIGLIVIVAVYFFSRRKRVQPAGPEPFRQPDAEPYVGGLEPTAEGATITPPPASEPTQPKATAPTDDQLILTIHVVARTSEGFAAAGVASALAAAGLQFGRYGIYHYTDHGDGRDWFSAANMVEPGRFPEPDSDERVPGITLFMMMPGLPHPQDALDALLAAARRLAADLDGDLADGRRKPFTAQAAQRMREDLAAFQARHALV
ncbi:MAG TPA: cell division protein ZipA C-terminal FtsZ-binding domain-containing protein [Gammaproteobacteria bacterium]|nr:cell division protein ZipA C-terminal FtsZ-binding domain-containing protein [Gammaproteobacteria bacterium]